MRKLSNLITLFAGAGDTLSGIVLLALPAAALRSARLPVPAETIYLRFIGAFVLSIGLTYLLGLLRNRVRPVWEVTFPIRIIVGLFVIAATAAGALAVGWVPVGIADIALGLIQALFLSAGWVTPAER